MKTWFGSCHCRAIGYEYQTYLEPTSWSVRACQCSFCRAHEAICTSDPSGALTFRAEDPRLLQTYRFGLGTADFLVCRQCGVYIGAQIESPNGRFGIINTRALIDRPDNLPKTREISYDNENTEGRVSRRGERWTPVRQSPV